jgi:hypothetical protein
MRGSVDESAAVRDAHGSPGTPEAPPRSSRMPPGKLAKAKARTRKPPRAQDVLVTPDKRYLLVDGRLWRTTNPHLKPARKEKLVRELMSARRAVNAALKAFDTSAERLARRRVHKAKVSLGERGPVWWTDGAPDLNRRLVKNTPYAGWSASLSA